MLCLSLLRDRYTSLAFPYLSGHMHTRHWRDPARMRRRACHIPRVRRQFPRDAAPLPRRAGVAVRMLTRVVVL